MLLAVAVVLLLGLAAATTNAGHGGRPRSTRSTPAPLRPPTDLYASYGTSDGAVVISWQPSRPAPVGYRIYRATGRHGPYTIVGSVDAPDMDTFTDSSGLMPGMTYAYTVTAFDRQGESAPLGPIVVVMVAPPGPSPTVGLPTPLPTFAPVTSPTLTAIARVAQRVAPTARATRQP